MCVCVCVCIFKSFQFTFLSCTYLLKGFPGGSVVEESTSQAGGIGLIPVEDSWSRKRQPTIVFLPGIFHGPRSLLGYRAWARKESHKTEQLNNNILYFNNIRGPYKRLCMSETWNI